MTWTAPGCGCRTPLTAAGLGAAAAVSRGGVALARVYRSAAPVAACAMSVATASGFDR